VGLALDKLSVLGPILVLKLKFDPEEYQRRLVAEFWLYPDDSRVLELSTKRDPQEAFLVAAETRAFLSRRDVDLSDKQETRRCERSSSLRRGSLTRPRKAMRRPPQGDDEGRMVEFGPWLRDLGCPSLPTLPQADEDGTVGSSPAGRRTTLDSTLIEA
jgi:hypothetical protein